ncbi:MAG TPA: hypothetical protein VJJ20_00395 [Candidatus Paceibacterota bacterium]
MQQVITTNHDEIRAWAQGRGGMPAIVEGSEADLRFDWGEGDSLMRISWREFLEIFEDQALAFAHIENDDSSVYEFVPRRGEDYE